MTEPDAAALERGVLPASWVEDEAGGHAAFRVHRYNSDFVILRQSGRTHFEKPFLYLIFGSARVVQFDICDPAFFIVAGHRHHVVIVHWSDLFGRVRVVLGNVHPRFRHDLHRVRVHPVLLDPRRVGFDHVSLEVARPSLSHLAAARVAGAQEQHADAPAGPLLAYLHCRHPAPRPDPGPSGLPSTFSRVYSIRAIFRL